MTDYCEFCCEGVRDVDPMCGTCGDRYCHYCSPSINDVISKLELLRCRNKYKYFIISNDDYKQFLEDINTEEFIIYAIELYNAYENNKDKIIVELTDLINYAQTNNENKDIFKEKIETFFDLLPDSLYFTCYLCHQGIEDDKRKDYCRFCNEIISDNGNTCFECNRSYCNSCTPESNEDEDEDENKDDCNKLFRCNICIKKSDFRDYEFHDDY